MSTAVYPRVSCGGGWKVARWGRREDRRRNQESRYPRQVCTLLSRQDWSGRTMWGIFGKGLPQIPAPLVTSCLQSRSPEPLFHRAGSRFLFGVGLSPDAYLPYNGNKVLAAGTSAGLLCCPGNIGLEGGGCKALARPWGSVEGGCCLSLVLNLTCLRCCEAPEPLAFQTDSECHEQALGSHTRPTLQTAGCVSIFHSYSIKARKGEEGLCFLDHCHHQGNCICRLQKP